MNIVANARVNCANLNGVDIFAGGIKFYLISQPNASSYVSQKPAASVFGDAVTIYAAIHMCLYF